MGFILILVLFVLFWAFLIRPKQRELKRHQSLVATLDVGDEVMTGSGFYGVITEVGDDTVRMELAPGLEVKVARRAVASKVSDPSVEAHEALPAFDPSEVEDEGDDVVDPEVGEPEIVDAEIADEDLVDDDDVDEPDDREPPR